MASSGHSPCLTFFRPCTLGALLLYAVLNQSVVCLTLWDPMDCSPPGSSVHGDSPGKNTGVDCHPLLQGIFPTQGSNPRLLHCRQILHHLSHQGSLGALHAWKSTWLISFQVSIRLTSALSSSNFNSGFSFMINPQLLEPTQTHVHWVSDAIQPSHPLSSPFPPTFSLS